MKIGFIGAGKVGFTFGKYLTERNVTVTGYFSRSPQSSLEAADFTNTKQYINLRQLVEDSDAIFISVPDGAISHVWEQLKLLPIQDKIISHFSGSLSSAVFSDIERYRAYGYSIHPLYAVNDKYKSYLDLSKALITLEGHQKYMSGLKTMFKNFGNRVETIRAEHKVKYHATAAMASNLYVGLMALCEKQLRECGFSAENAHVALAPLILGNTENIIAYGTTQALTGPIERNDLTTVCEHLDCLSEESKEVYRCLSRQVLEVAKTKHPQRDYSDMEKELKE